MGNRRRSHDGSVIPRCAQMTPKLFTAPCRSPLAAGAAFYSHIVDFTVKMAASQAVFLKSETPVISMTYDPLDLSFYRGFYRKRSQGVLRRV